MKKKPNIFWILLDACRQDRLSCYGCHKRTSPNLEKLSQESTVFDNAIANANWTYPSVASMFTGLYPAEHGAHNRNIRLRRDIPTLAEILGNNGYSTIAVAQKGGWMNPIFGLPKGFKKLYDKERINTSPLPNLSSKMGEIFSWFYRASGGRYFTGYENLTEYVVKKEIRNIKKPFFLFLQLMDTHLPYTPPIRFQKFGNKAFPYSIIPYEKLGVGIYSNIYLRRRKYNAGLNEFTDDEIELMNELYDGAIAYSDHQVGRYIDFLEDKKILDETFVVITADHGEYIGEYGLLGHEMGLHDILIKVPLIIRYPELFPQGERFHDQVEMKDIFYTLLDVAGLLETNEYRKNSLVEMIRLGKGKKYVFGEYPTKTDEIIKKMKQLNPSMYIPKYSKFVRSNEYKFVQHDDGREDFYSLRREEKKVDPANFLEEFKKIKEVFNNWKVNIERKNRLREMRKAKDGIKKLKKRKRL